MKSFLSFLVKFSILVGMSSCGMVEKMATKTTADLIYVGSPAAQKEKNLKKFEMAVPANLQFLESLLENDPENEKLLLGLIQGNAGYGFVHYETLYLEDYFKEIDNSPYKNQANYYYSRSIYYGMKFLSFKGIQFSQLQKIKDENAFIKKLDNEIGRSNISSQIIFYLAQAWGGLINLNKDNLTLVSQLSIVERLFQWSCSIDPTIQNGACLVFKGALLSGRPKMLGGDSEEGQKKFLEAIKTYPHNLFNRIAYLTFFIIPREMEEEFHEQVKIIEEKREEYSSYYVPGKKLTSAIEDFGLVNSMSFKRLDIIKKYSQSFF